VPDLSFTIEGSEPLPYAAAPTVALKLRVENRGDEQIRSVMLRSQIQIAVARRQYTQGEQEGLYELFGSPSQWGSSLKTMLWANTVELLPPFTGGLAVDLRIPCTYDFEVATAKYFHGLEDGDVPLEVLFSGSVFYDAGAGLQVEQLSWDKEAAYRMPVRVWKDTMERYFPNSAWLRVRRDVFDRLYAYKARHGAPSWDAALEALLKTGHEELAAKWTQ
jgi:hypothetical protein